MTQKAVELSRFVDIGDIKEHKELHTDIQATADECRALAKRFGILEVNKLAAKVGVKAKGGDFFKVTVAIQANVVQACSVTLVPVPEVINESFEETLTTNPETILSEEETDADIEKPVEVIEGNVINVGEIVAQWLALSLDPYPRSDAPLYEYVEDDATFEGKQTHTPFDILGKLKDT